ncbi:MAG: HAD family hydrolase [Chloroflexota bacterium]|nr:HAD family hydrolase [Chloroflexota bacterium]
MTVRAVFFDVGETLVDETRSWAAWADWLGVPQLTLFAILGGVIERGEHHLRAFEIVRPGFDYPRAEAARAAVANLAGFAREDLYPDAIPCLEALRAGGYFVGVAGNQTARFARTIEELGLPVDAIASSAAWGVAKPSPAFFARVAATAGLPLGQIAYVGDRLDHDVLPARAAGMLAVFLRRGPWGYLHAARSDAAQAHIRLESLLELPDALEHHRADDPTTRKDAP